MMGPIRWCMVLSPCHDSMYLVERPGYKASTYPHNPVDTVYLAEHGSMGASQEALWTAVVRLSKPSTHDTTVDQQHVNAWWLMTCRRQPCVMPQTHAVPNTSFDVPAGGLSHTSHGNMFGHCSPYHCCGCRQRATHNVGGAADPETPTWDRDGQQQRYHWLPVALATPEQITQSPQRLRQRCQKASTANAAGAAVFTFNAAVSGDTSCDHQQRDHGMGL